MWLTKVKATYEIKASDVLSEDELSTICRWVESSSNDEIRAQMAAMKGMLPAKYRKVTGSIYRGVAATSQLVEHLKNGGSVTTNEVEAWSRKKAVAANFMLDIGYEYGILFQYQPSTAEVIVDIDAASHGCEELGYETYGEGEIVLAQLTLTQNNVVDVKANSHFDGSKRPDNMKMVS